MHTCFGFWIVCNMPLLVHKNMYFYEFLKKNRSSLCKGKPIFRTIYYMEKITLKDFLKKYTAISEKFIDKYYKFYEMCEDNKFGINIDSILKYLELNNKKKFIERLREKYTVNQDFVIKRIKQKSQKGIPDVFYYISFDCFEKICMASKSKKGNAVRDYFVTLRKFIEYYRQHISNMIIDKAIEGKAVYIILVNKNKNIFKIGQTAKSMRKRLYAYSTGRDKHPDIKFIMLSNDPKQIETCSKVILEKSKVRGKQEIYKIDPELIKEIITGCAELNDIVNKKNNKGKYNLHIVFDDTKTIEYLDLDNNVIISEKSHKYVKK